MSTEYQWSRPDAGGSGHCVDGEAECRRAIRTEVAAGADLIKIYVTSGLYDPFLGKPRDEFSKKEIEALCDEAANSGKKVAAHCHTAKSVSYTHLDVYKRQDYFRYEGYLIRIVGYESINDTKQSKANRHYKCF